MSAQTTAQQAAMPSAVSAGHRAASSAAADFSVNLAFFSGPMDLLLHLVQQQEVSIEEVSMRDIAEQYLKVISNTRWLDLEKAAEYLVIAATLISIKSAKLLPGENIGADGEPIEEGSAAFLEELRARLKTYEHTKLQARALSELPHLGIETFTRVDRSGLLPTPEMLQAEEDSAQLGTLFAKMLRRIGASTGLRISVEPVSVVSWMVRLVDRLGMARPNGPMSLDKAEALKEAAAAAQPASFSRIFSDFLSLKFQRFSERMPKILRVEPKPEEKIRHRAGLVACFIAVLELMKRGMLSAEQPQSEGDILLRLRIDNYGEAAQASDLESEFDAQALEDNEQDASEASDDDDAEADQSKVIDINTYRRGKGPRREG